MKKNVIFFHLTCFILLTFVCSFFLFYQVFVDINSRRISISSFIKPRTLLAAFKKLHSQSIPTNTSALYSIDQGFNITNVEGNKVAQAKEKAYTKMFTIGKKKYLTQITSDSLIVTDVDNQQVFTVPLETDEVFEVLGWQNETQLILSKKSVQFSILKIDLNTLSSTVIIPEITYSGESISSNYSSKISIVVYPECNPKCSFMLFDLEKNEVIEQVPAFTEPSHAASLTNVKLLFFDETKGYIAYEVPESIELYLIDRQLNFLQYVRLENDRNSTHFISYFPQAQQLLFSLQEKNSREQTIALVAANSPSLHVLTEADEFYPVLASPLAGVYQWGDTLFDLNGKRVMEPVDSLLISTF